MTEQTDRPTPPPAILTGEATVRLVLTVDEVYSPEEAAEEFINQIVRDGLNQMVLVVSDDENIYFVQDGELIDLVEDEGRFRVVDYYTGADREDDDEDEDDLEDDDEGEVEVEADADDRPPVAPPLESSVGEDAQG